MTGCHRLDVERSGAFGGYIPGRVGCIIFGHGEKEQSRIGLDDLRR
jgi:hypothetical protein